MCVFVEAPGSERVEGRQDLSLNHRLNVCILVKALSSEKVEGRPQS